MENRITTSRQFEHDTSSPFRHSRTKNGRSATHGVGGAVVPLTDLGVGSRGCLRRPWIPYKSQAYSLERGMECNVMLSTTELSLGSLFSLCIHLLSQDPDAVEVPKRATRALPL